MDPCAFLRVLVPLCVLSIAIAPLPAAAADAAAIKGAIVDPAGSRVAGATVTLIRDGVAVTATTSNGQGDYAFTELPEGRYQIQATAEGFQSRLTRAIFLGAGAAAIVDVPLPLGPLETEVTVTASATAILPSQIGAPVTVLDEKTLDAIGKTDVLEALRLIPGASLVQTAGRGGTTSIFIRGGNSNFNKVLIDGIPANDIGGGIDLSALQMAGVERIEALRDANSVIAGTDALSGVISIISRRGRTRVPEASLSLDGGNLGTSHETGSLGGVVQRVDYFSELSHLATDNSTPNNAYRTTTYAGRFGAAVGHSTDVSGTIRWIDKRYESPNGISLFGIPDDAYQTNAMHLIGLGTQTQITDRWQASARVGLSDQRAHFVNPTLSGQNVAGTGFGGPITITGANGYSVTGQGALDFGPYDSQTRSTRQGVYVQTTYQVRPTLSVSGGGDYEREQGYTNPGADPIATRHNGTLWVEGRGSLIDRVNVTAGLGYAHIEGYATRYAPRLSVAASLRKPTGDEFWSDTRLTLNAGTGIKATTITSVTNSLYTLLQKTPAGAALAAGAGIGPIGPERGRNFDLGIEQGLWRGRARARVSYFNNEFFDLVEFVSRNLLPQFGIPADVAAAAGSGAYVNSQSYTAKGVEASGDTVVGRVRVAASYTYLDAAVTRSLSSSVTPQFNPSFPGVAIGGFSALVGQRPFRRPANTGSLLVSYTQGPATLALTGYFAGKSDDSTFLVGSDLNFGNTLLLPNHDLDAGYQKVDASGSWQVHPRLKWFATIENVLNQHYEPAFGFPALSINVRTGVTVAVGGRSM